MYGVSMHTPDILIIIFVLTYYLWPYLAKPKTWLILLLGVFSWQGVWFLFD